MSNSYCDHKCDVSNEVSGAPIRSRKIKPSHVLLLFAYYVGSGIASFLTGYLIFHSSSFEEDKELATTPTNAALVGSLGSIVVGAVLAPLAAQYLPEYRAFFSSFERLKRALGPSSFHNRSPIVLPDWDDIIHTLLYLCEVPFVTNVVAGLIGYAILGAGRIALGLQEPNSLNWASAGGIALVGFTGGDVIHAIGFLLGLIYYRVISSLCADMKPRDVEKGVCDV